MSTALYRRYRPDSFDDVIGQDHVTTPLRAALRSNKVSHAYLFSGPRGCGKTTSARILARCLNCAQGPTDTPCGQCDSCRELATGGPGSLDVVEMDAASHGGVDDARELRERAAFAPVRDRFKIFIIDEAHMVTSQGFNALLKLVEEPPDHVKFIFATTEPDKVLNTIRSRTHHYPFRLVPPDVMQPFLQHLCDSEQVHVDDGVLGMVMRAGGGSVRDTLSVLDQLMAGAVDGVLNYQQTVALLGYTDTALLDQTVDSLASGDGAAAYSVIERMVDSGHDPRRFVEDFLQRLRDLLIIAVAGDQATQVLTGTPVDQLQRMQVQARTWGGPSLSRAADLTDQALRTMVGATSPRLQLELLIGRILVPSQVADISVPQGGHAQPPSRSASAGAGSGAVPVARESRVFAAQPQQGAADEHFGPEQAKEQIRRALHPEKASPRAGSYDPTGDEGRPMRQSGQQPLASRGAADLQSLSRPDSTESAQRSAQPIQTHKPLDHVPPKAPQVPTHNRQPSQPIRPNQPMQPSYPIQHSQGSVADQIRHKWPEILDALKPINWMTWRMMNADAKLASVTDNSVVVAFLGQGQLNNFNHNDRAHDVEQAIQQVVSHRVEVHAQVGQTGTGQPQTSTVTSNSPRSAADNQSAWGTAPHANTPGYDQFDESRKNTAPHAGRTDRGAPLGGTAGQDSALTWPEPVAPVPGGGEEITQTWTEPVAQIPLDSGTAASHTGATGAAVWTAEDDWSEPVADATFAEETQSEPESDDEADPAPGLEPASEVVSVAASEPHPGLSSEPALESVSEPGSVPEPDIHFQPEADAGPQSEPRTSPLGPETQVKASRLETRSSTSTFHAGPGGRTLQVVSNDDPELEEEFDSDLDTDGDQDVSDEYSEPSQYSELDPFSAPIHHSEPEPEAEAEAEIESAPTPQTQPSSHVQAADDDSASPDDDEADLAPNIGLPAVLSILGGKVIEEKEE